MTIPIAISAAVIVLVLLSGIRSAQKYQRGVVFRLGRYKGLRGPGLYWIFPLGIERSVTIDTRTRILVVEDNVVNQDVALGILHKLGFRAEAVADGAEAVEVLKTLPYDLVLMDVQMPEMDGLEATHLIRDADSPVLNHQVPIIAMTALALQGNRRMCLRAGMNDYLTKPVSLQALVDVLNVWLPSEIPGTRPDVSAGEVPVGKSVPEAPVFDRRDLVARMMDDEALADRILTRFLESTPSQIESLQKLLDTGDATAAQHTAHALKGASANIGEGLRQIAFAIEQAAHVGDLDTAKSRLAKFQLQFDRLTQAIQAKG